MSTSHVPKKPKRSKRRRLPKDATIAITGGGLGGLSAAIALKKAGFTNVTVYERDAHFSERRDGYGLTLSYNPKGPLAKLGLLETVARVDCPSRSHYVFKPDGSILGYYGNVFHIVGASSSSVKRKGLGQRGNLRVPRQVLRQIMIDELLADDTDINNGGKAAIKWGKRLVSFQDRVAQMDGNSFSCDEGGRGAVSLKFHDGTVEEVDLLIGSDGIRSTVTRTLLNESNDDERTARDSLSYLGVAIVLGITDNFFHPLLDERGFYTLDGNNRLFTMPFAGSRLDDMLESDDKDKVKARRRYMWQLSWREPDESRARKLSQSSPEVLIKEIEQRCNGWHEPVLDMVRATSSKNVWGTALQDRDPQTIMSLVPGFRTGGKSRVVVLGDAIHAMSCFKGQGANQALADGPLLALWLEKSSIDSSIRGFMREMVARTRGKVKASRVAANFLHSPSVLQETEDFAGVKKDMVPDFLNFLEKSHIDASMGGKMDASIFKLLRNNRNKYIPPSVEEAGEVNSGEIAILQKEALAYASGGDTAGLRRLSADIIHGAVDSEGRNCLHLAALGGHYYTCRFLLTESFMPHDALASNNNTPLHYACMCQNAQTVRLLSTVSTGCEICWNKNAEGLKPSMILNKCTDEELRGRLIKALH